MLVFQMSALHNQVEVAECCNSGIEQTIVWSTDSGGCWTHNLWIPSQELG